MSGLFFVVYIDKTTYLIDYLLMAKSLLQSN